MAFAKVFLVIILVSVAVAVILLQPYLVPAEYSQYNQIGIGLCQNGIQEVYSVCGGVNVGGEIGKPCKHNGYIGYATLITQQGCVNITNTAETTRIINEHGLEVITHQCLEGICITKDNMGHSIVLGRYQPLLEPEKFVTANNDVITHRGGVIRLNGTIVTRQQAMEADRKYSYTIPKVIENYSTTTLVPTNQNLWFTWRCQADDFQLGYADSLAGKLRCFKLPDKEGYILGIENNFYIYDQGKFILRPNNHPSYYTDQEYIIKMSSVIYTGQTQSIIFNPGLEYFLVENTDLPNGNKIITITDFEKYVYSR